MSSIPVRPILTAIAAGFGAAIIAAIVLAIVDIYLSGHGRPTLGRPWISLFNGALPMSRAEALFYLSFLAGSVVGWRHAVLNP
jgi:hypothetical protein